MTDAEIVREFERALRSNDPGPLPRAIIDIRPAKDEEHDVKEELRKVVHRMTVGKALDNPKGFSFKDVSALYFEARDAGSPGYVMEVLNLLRLYQVIGSHIRTFDLRGENWFGGKTLPDAAQRLIAAVERLDGFDSQLFSSKLVLGKLHALESRQRASRWFADASSMFDAFVPVFRGEAGTNTYFDDAALGNAQAVVAERRESLPKRREYGPICSVDPRFLVVMSCERKFLRIYLPYWLSVAEYLKQHGFAYHFLITEPADAASDLVADADNVRRALGTFRGYDPATFGQNVSFSSVEVPAWCPSLRTFSACARFLYARDISEQTGMRVFVQDIDYYLTGIPFPWFEALPVDKIAISSKRARVTIDPWRKFLCGDYVLPHTEEAFALDRRVGDYLLLGLGEEYSWHLDQNVLAYLYDIAVEESASNNGRDLLFSLADLRPIMSPNSGFATNVLWEQIQGT